MQQQMSLFGGEFWQACSGMRSKSPEQAVMLKWSAQMRAGFAEREPVRPSFGARGCPSSFRRSLSHSGGTSECLHFDVYSRTPKYQSSHKTAMNKKIISEDHTAQGRSVAVISHSCASCSPVPVQYEVHILFTCSFSAFLLTDMRPI